MSLGKRFSFKHKFLAKHCARGQLKFDSKLERSAYDLLQVLKNAGEVLAILRQVPVDIPSGKHYIDFLVFTKDDTYFLEIKGRDLDAGRVRRLTAEDKLGVQIHVVHKPEEIPAIIFPLRRQ